MPSATLIGDLLGSRTAADRSRLHAVLGEALASVNATLGPPTPLRITVGDEFQGVFATVGDAARATLRIRLALLPDHDVRHGLGWGEVSILQEEPRVEDGPGWWAARDALEGVETGEDRAEGRGRRTAYLAAPGTGGTEAASLNAALALRDQLVGGLSERSVSVLRGLLDGRTQRDLAEELGISPSAVSQRVRHDGLATVVAADRLLGEVS
jgi:DNA-binding transcriptional LysR family regulator